MTRKITITVPQFFTMLIISRLMLSLTYNPLMFSGESMWDDIISVAISFVMTFILVIPIYKLYKRDTKMTIADNILNCFGKIGTLLILVYAVYYLFVCCYSLSLFNVFISNVMDPSLSIKILSVAIVLTSCYGAYKGLEGLARASSIIMFIIFIAMTFLIAALVPKIDVLNFTPLLYNGTGQMTNSTFLILSRMSCIVAMGMLFPFVKGNIKKGIVTWNVVLHLSMGLIITILVGSLGEYISTHVFPVYAATSIAEIGMLKRLDALYLGIFTTGLFVKISLFLFLFSLAISKVFNEKVGRTSIFFGGAIVSLIGIIFSDAKDIGQFLYSTTFVFSFTIILGVVIPILLIVISFFKRRKDEKVEKGI